MTVKYIDLVKQFELRPIRTDFRLAEAREMMTYLLSNELTYDKADYLEILHSLINTYEVSTRQKTQGDVLLSLLEKANINQTVLSKAIGISSSAVSKMLSNDRGISRKNMIRLGKFFQVSPALFLKEFP